MILLKFREVNHNRVIKKGNSLIIFEEKSEPQTCLINLSNNQLFVDEVTFILRLSPSNNDSELFQ